MKIRITYSDNEKADAAEAENILKGLLSTKQIKIRKPEKNGPYSHTYMTVGKNK